MPLGVFTYPQLRRELKRCAELGEPWPFVLAVIPSSGAQATVGACQRFGKPCMPVYPGASFEPSHVATWIAENEIRTLNVAGNRESDESGIGDRVERFLAQVLQLLGHVRA